MVGFGPDRLNGEVYPQNGPDFYQNVAIYRHACPPNDSYGSDMGIVG